MPAVPPLGQFGVVEEAEINRLLDLVNVVACKTTYEMCVCTNSTFGAECVDSRKGSAERGRVVAMEPRHENRVLSERRLVERKLLEGDFSVIQGAERNSGEVSPFDSTSPLPRDTSGATSSVCS